MRTRAPAVFPQPKHRHKIGDDKKFPGTSFVNGLSGWLNIALARRSIRSQQRRMSTDNPPARRPIRLMYAAGPGNVTGTYQHWKSGQDDPSQVSVTYSGQFLDVCKSLDADALVISSCPQNGTVKDGPFELKHVPRLFPNARGLFYHIAEILYGIRVYGRRGSLSSRLHCCRRRRRPLVCTLSIAFRAVSHHCYRSLHAVAAVQACLKPGSPDEQALLDGTRMPS